MKKITNIICLILWSICLGTAILTSLTGGTINPISHIGACLICVMHHVEELLLGND